MKKGLKSAEHSGSVQVTFNVSKDVASHIRQSVVGSWRRLQDLGVVSVHLDKEQLMSDNSELCTESPKIQNAEFQHCTQPSYPFNGYAKSEAVLDFCNTYSRSRGGKRSRKSGHQTTRRMRNNGCEPVLQIPSNERCSSLPFTTSVIEEGMICRIGSDASQSFNLDGGACLTGSEHVLCKSVQNVSSSQLSQHTSSDVAFGGIALSSNCHALSAKNPFTVNMLQPETVKVDSVLAVSAVQSHDLPPPSTPFVPKRRKRRKTVDNSLEAVSAESPSNTALNYYDHTVLPVPASGSVSSPPSFYWQNCTTRQFQLNGHYPQQFNSPVFDHHNARLLQFTYAGSHCPVTLADHAKLPTERQMVLDSSTVSATTAAELKDVISTERNVPAGTSQLLQPLPGSNVSYSVRSVCGQLYQPTVLSSSQRYSPNLLNCFSQDAMALRHCNPEMYHTYAATTAETKVSDCAKHFCSSANVSLQDVSSAFSTERNLYSEVNTSDSTLRIKPDAQTPTLLSSEVHSSESLSPVLKSSETASGSSVDVRKNIHCSSAVNYVISAESSNSSNSSSDFVVLSDRVDSKMPVTTSAVVKKCKSDVINGYHFYNHAEAQYVRHVMMSSSAVQTVNTPSSCLSTAANEDVDNSYSSQVAADHSVFTKPAPNMEMSHVARTLHSENVQNPCAVVYSVNSIENNRTVSGRLFFSRFSCI